MKYLFSAASCMFLIILFAFTSINAQDGEVRSQSEHMKSLKPGKYLVYDINGDRHEVLNGGEYTYHLSSNSFEVKKIAPEKLFPNKHFSVEIASSTFDGPASTYIPDDFGFPITYTSWGYVGHSKWQEENGYAHEKAKTGSTEDRLVVLDDLAYFLRSYKGPSDFVIRILVPEGYTTEAETKEKKSLKEKMQKVKEAAKLAAAGMDYNSKKLEEEGAVQKIIDYMAAAQKKQQEVSAAWAKTAEGKAYLKRTEAMRNAWIAFVKNDNEEYWNSEEYQRIRALDKRLAQEAAAEKVTIVNETGRDIFIYESGSRNGSAIRANSSSTANCQVNLSYSFSGNSEPGSVFYSANSGCGSTVTVR
jgi:hypothetical protein